MEAETTEKPPAPFLNECGICKDEFKTKDTKLKLLGCLHTFCSNCLSTLDSPGPHNFHIVKCTICQQESQVNSVISNQFFNSPEIPNAEEKQPSEEVKPCTSCEEENANATSYCHECEEWLCDQCVQAHRRVKVTKDHNVVPKEQLKDDTKSEGDKVPYCPVHRSELLKLYCETCDQLTCRDCQLVSHKDHKYQFITEASKSYKCFLQNILGKIKEKRTYIENAKALIDRRNKEIAEKEKNVLSDVKLYFIKMINEINKRGKQLLTDLNAICGAKKSQLSQKNQEIVALSERLDHALKFAEFVLAHGSNTAILYSKKLLVQQLRHILRTRCEVPNPYHVVDIRFQASERFITDSIGKQGSIVVDGVTYQGLDTATGQPIGQPATPQNVNTKNLPPHAKAAILQKLLQLQQQSQRSPGGSPTSTMTHPNFPGQAGSGSGTSLLHQNKPSTNSVSSSKLVKTGSVYYPPSGLNQKQANPSPLGMINLAQLHQHRINRQMQQQRHQFANNSSVAPIVIQPTSTATATSYSMAELGIKNEKPYITEYPESKMNPGQKTTAGTPIMIGEELSDMNGYQQSSPDGHSPSRPSSSGSNQISSNVGPNESLGNQDDHAKDMTQRSVPVPGDDEDNPDPLAFLDSVRDQNKKLLGDALLADVPLESDITKENGSKESNNPNESNFPSPGTLETDSGPILANDNHGDGELFKADHPILDSIFKDSGSGDNNKPTNEDPSEDWCAVCHNGGDLLCCDRCPKVFHLKCYVPELTQAPTDLWHCALCQTIDSLRMDLPEERESVLSASGTAKRKAATGLTDKELKVCERILLELFSHEASVPFHEPVSKSVPNYYKMINTPMDFMKIRRKLNRAHFNHYQSLEEFVTDVQLVFANCATYNIADSEVGRAGKKIEAFFEEMLQRFLPFFEMRSSTPHSNISVHSTNSDPSSDRPRNKRKKRPEEIVHYKS